MAVVLNPYLHFNDGKTKEAMEFYKSIFGGKLKISTFGEFPNPSITEEMKDHVMHAVLETDHLQIMASDTDPVGDVTVGGNVELSISGDDEEALRGYFNGLCKDGKITMTLEKQAWGDLFGMVTDKYGINWMVNIAVPKS